ncbi:Gfo/Idh/MocA family oxidoreductase [Ravibacter arvi]|uniref:Gfo/Idh/MocA family oxidoreductase n=1 Tax=Ravibacter arvi TaxID=2051041 RepID=A0ABP8LUH1_9BACT
MNRILFVFSLILFAATAQVIAKPVRLAVAGISHGHSGWIFNRFDLTGIEIVGIYETNRELVNAFRSRYKLPATLFYDDLGAMLDQLKPDGVMAFGPVNEHVEVVRAAAPRKVHVMVEKPLATTYADALEIQKLAARNHIKVLTNFETSWYASNQYVKDLYEKGALGDLRKVMVNDGHGGPSQMDKHFIAWLADPVKNGGGALTDFGCYGGNLMTWLMKGERPLSVTAVTHQNRPDLYPKVDDEATIVLQYPGVQCVIQASWSWSFSRKDMEVYGTKGYAVAVDKENVRQRLEAKKQEETRKVPPLPAPFENPFQIFAGVITGALELQRNDWYELPVNVTTVEILEAARESSKTGKTVFLNR